MVTIAPRGKRAGSSVISGTIYLPRVGAWVADLRVDADTALAGPVDISIDDKKLVGTVTERSAVVEGTVHLRAVAGGNGLTLDVKGQHYTNPTVRNVLGRIAQDVGEKLSADGDASMMSTQLEHWTTLVMPAGRAVRALVSVLPVGAVWRVRADGGLWVGTDTWPDSGLRDVAIVADPPEDAMFEVALEVPYLLPGTTVAGRKADTVMLSFGAGGASARIWTRP